MTQESKITDEVKAVIGVESVSPPELVEMKAIRDYAIAINFPDPPNPLHIDAEYARMTRYCGIIAPWSFYTALGHTLRQERVPLPKPRVLMNGGNEYEYLLPIRPGDVIVTKSKIAEVTQREGKAGPLVLVVTQRTFTNQNGEVVGIARGTNIFQY